MEYNKKLFWKIILIIVLGLFAASMFFLLSQLPRDYHQLLPTHPLNTNIGAFLICIGFGLVLYYVLNRPEFSAFFEKRIAFQNAKMSNTPEYQEYQKLRQSIITGLPAGMILDRKELVRKGNMYLILWLVFCGAVIIGIYFLFTTNFASFHNNEVWAVVGMGIIVMVGYLIDDGYRKNAVCLMGCDSKKPTGVERIFSGAEEIRSPLRTFTLILLATVFILSAGGIFLLVPPASRQGFFGDPAQSLQLLQVVVLIGLLSLGIEYYIFRLKD